MATRVEALLTPELLLWSRKTAGFSLEDAAKRVKLKPELLESWEQGQARPSIPQLRKLAKLYKRPLAVFYLPEPPMTFKALRDYRKLPAHAPLTESPELRYEIRRAHELRATALELYEELEETPPELQLRISLDDDPEVIAGQIRQMLGLTYGEQRKWKSGYDARNWWRSALEQIGVLVFQVSDVEVDEMRGFSISERPLPVVAVNSKDRVNGRIFTMLHEFIHILLNDNSLCTLDEHLPRRNNEQRVEVFCNHVAGATLVPQSYLQMENELSGKKARSEWDDEIIQTLARKYSVSRETILRRLLTLGYTTEDFYRKKRDDFLEEYEELAKQPTIGFTQPDRAAINAVGPSFVRVVLNGYYQDKITALDVSTILNVRTKHIDNIERMVRG